MEKNNSLYSIKSRFIELFEKAEFGELTPEEMQEQGNELARELQNKSTGIIGYTRNQELLIQAIKEEENRLAENRKAIENKLDRFKEYVKSNMQELAVEKIETPLGVLSVVKNPASVEIVDETMIPSEYKIKKETYTPDKKAIKEALKNGENILGVKLIEDKTSLRIK